ncbi:proposed F420-0 ABC transporter, periplasmic F420-0 binding protein [Cedecea lapagei]|uniref:Proposed F420-0 ABC transporter, periplasmic F420-0 binding protein n=1 Tax=Cedecea lapagei TaxID=158823 RepID=A0A447V438_9ENTR|nr:proposed F420-0 ABC transporter, periplasmic F420-0 binding protein [Cedecea lapagei]
MMLKIVTGILLAFTSTAVLASGFPVTVKSCGKPVVFNAAPKRAVINDLNMSEMAFALDLQKQIVGLTGISGWYKMTPEFKQKMGAIPELAPKYPSLETLLAAEPDFFFAGWNYGMKVGGRRHARKPREVRYQDFCAERKLCDFRREQKQSDDGPAL